MLMIITAQTKFMKYHFELQNPNQYSSIPNQFLIQRWLEETLKHQIDSAEVCIRVVDETESAKLNHQFRKKNYPTNVLSFPSDIPKEVMLERRLLGDIVICAPVLATEAKQQNKPLTAHWAHMLVHSLLHLLGYDHITDNDAEKMEQLEITILKKLGFQDPYSEANRS